LVCVSIPPPPSPSLAGLKQIHALSIQGNYELRVDLEDFENSTAYAQYGTFGVGLFSVDPDDDGYPLTVGHYSGNAGTEAPPAPPARTLVRIVRFLFVCLFTFVSTDDLT